MEKRLCERERGKMIGKKKEKSTAWTDDIMYWVDDDGLFLLSLREVIVWISVRY